MTVVNKDMPFRNSLTSTAISVGQQSRQSAFRGILVIELEDLAKDALKVTFQQTLAETVQRHWDQPKRLVQIDCQ